MRIGGLILCVALSLGAGMPSASATMRIAEDRGGQIGHYLQAFAMLRTTGERVVIDGDCLSACTLVLGMIPRRQMCVTDRAVFGFHAAWMPDRDGRPVTSNMGTAALWNVYPLSVRHWIVRHGGLSRRMIYLQGRDLAAIVPSCSAPRHLQARSHRYAPRRTYRYIAGNASSYRR